MHCHSTKSGQKCISLNTCTYGFGVLVDSGLSVCVVVFVAAVMLVVGIGAEFVTSTHAVL